MKTRLSILLLLLCFGATPGSLTAQSKGRTAVLQTLGAQGGALLYNTYCLIGAMHDGYLTDSWEKDEVLTILDEQSNLMTTISEEYDTLLATGYLDEDDSLTVIQMRECCFQLKLEADYLADYVNDETTENHDRYLEARAAAWKLIAELLGFETQSTWGGTQREQQGTH